MRREIREELGLDLAAEDVDLVLWFEQHQENTRPGRGGLFRRRHPVHVARLPRPLAKDVALVELDAEDATEVLWLFPAELACAHLYPDLGGHLVDAVATSAVPAVAVPVLLLASMTDETYRWR
ncbi:hypothetical protein ACWEPB_26615 [Kitasatospora cineracea]